MKIFDNTFNAIERKLDLAIKRHSILTSNIANQETPNYIAREYNFSKDIENAMGFNSAEMNKTHSRHLDTTAQSGAHVSIDRSMPVGADGNNVDLDIEMGKLATNSRAYTGSLRLLTVKLQMLRSAISGGRGGA